MQQLMYVTGVRQGWGMIYREFQNYIHRTIDRKTSIVKMIYYCTYKNISGTITLIYDYIN